MYQQLNIVFVQNYFSDLLYIFETFFFKIKKTMSIERFKYSKFNNCWYLRNIFETFWWYTPTSSPYNKKVYLFGTKGIIFFSLYTRLNFKIQFLGFKIYFYVFLFKGYWPTSLIKDINLYNPRCTMCRNWMKVWNISMRP